MENQENTGIKVEFGTITIDEVSENAYKPNQDQAQIRQIVTKTYPSARVGNSNSDLLFAEDDFGIEDGQSYESTRVTWLPLPKGTTEEQVKAQLAKCPEARIFRIISNSVEDVLTKEQKSAISSPDIDISLEDFKEKYLIKDGDGNALEEEMYSQNFFSKTPVEDVDLRTPKMDVLAGAEADAASVVG